MYQRTLHIQKGLKNKVQIQFKNSDQKPLNVSTGTFVFNMFNATNQNRLVSKEIEILDDSTSTHVSVNQSSTGIELTLDDTSKVRVGQSVSGFGVNANTIVIGVSTATGIVTLSSPTLYPITSTTDVTFATTALRGLGQITFDEIDTIDVETGNYQFTVASIDQSGSYLPAYANTYYNVSGSLEVRQDSFPTLVSSQQVNSFQPIYNNSGMRWEYYSGNQNGGPQFSSFHTMAVYMTNFKGTLLFQGTQDNTPGYFGNYATVTQKTYNGFTGIDYITFEGNFTFVRLKYIPIANLTGDNSDTSYAGTVDQLLYRY